MDNLYNNFYAYNQAFYSAQSQQDFLTYRKTNSSEQFYGEKVTKNIQVTKPSTNNILNNFTLLTNPHNIVAAQKNNQIQFPSQQEIINQINSQLKNRGVYNKIKTPINVLQKTVKSYRGSRQQTVNLIKYYSTTLKDYLQTLSTCNIIQTSSLEKYKQYLKTNEISQMQLDQFTEEHCQKYIKSSEFMANILKSNKMNFYNKIISLKYVQEFKQKITNSSTDKKKWKNSKA